MTQVRVWSPFAEALAMSTAIDQAMRPAQREQGSRTFAMDLVENDEGYTLYAVMPGVNTDELQIEFADNVLTIKAQVQVPQIENVRYHVRERAGGTYERSLRFPTHINGEGITASYEHGILTLHLPRAEEVKPRRITVRASA